MFGLMYSVPGRVFSSISSWVAYSSLVFVFPFSTIHLVPLSSVSMSPCVGEYETSSVLFLFGVVILGCCAFRL